MIDYILKSGTFLLFFLLLAANGKPVAIWKQQNLLGVETNRLSDEKNLLRIEQADAAASKGVRVVCIKFCDNLSNGIICCSPVTDEVMLKGVHESKFVRVQHDVLFSFTGLRCDGQYIASVCMNYCDEFSKMHGSKPSISFLANEVSKTFHSALGNCVVCPCLVLC